MPLHPFTPSAELQSWDVNTVATSRMWLLSTWNVVSLSWDTYTCLMDIRFPRYSRKKSIFFLCLYNNYMLKCNASFTCLFFYLKNVAARTCKMKDMICTACLLESAGLEPLLGAHVSGTQPHLPYSLSLFTYGCLIPPTRVSVPWGQAQSWSNLT